MQNQNININWQTWCRLCANADSTIKSKLFSKNEQQSNVTMETSNDFGQMFELQPNELSLALAIEKHFLVKITSNEKLPTFLCTECLDFVTRLMNFSERVSKVQDMFCHILKVEGVNVDLNLPAMRLQFGLSDATNETLEQETSCLSVEVTNKTVISDPLQLVEENIKEENNTVNFEANENNRKEMTTNGKEQLEKENLKIIQNCAVQPAGKRVRKRKLCEDIKKEEKGKKRKRSISNVSNCDEAANIHSKFKCIECDRFYARSSTYYRHMRTIHSESLPKLGFKCSQCERIFRDRYKLRRHMETHIPLESRRVVPCPQCDKKFISQEMVQLHIDFMHKAMRPFICEKCGEPCRTSSELRSHMLTHSDYAPFLCEVCQKGYKTKYRLKKHMRMHATSKHICSVCGLELGTIDTLKRHSLVHSDEMQHKCDCCGRAFKRAKTLKNHLLLHTGLRPYSCGFCERTFTNGSNCRTHRKKSHPEELAALEAAGESKRFKVKIPKLKALKAMYV